jgi:hypothetical protein
MTSMSDIEIVEHLNRWINELPLSVGANNHMGSRATADQRVMNIVLSTLMQKNLFFVDSYTSSETVVRKTANNLNMRTISRDIFLDVPDSSFRTVRQKLEHIRNLGHKDIIVVITHCHNDTKLRQLVHFIDRLKDLGYQLVPPSYAFKRGINEITHIQ